MRILRSALVTITLFCGLSIAWPTSAAEWIDPSAHFKIETLADARKVAYQLTLQYIGHQMAAWTPTRIIRGKLTKVSGTVITLQQTKRTGKSKNIGPLTLGYGVSTTLEQRQDLVDVLDVFIELPVEAQPPKTVPKSKMPVTGSGGLGTPSPHASTSAQGSAINRPFSAQAANDSHAKPSRPVPKRFLINAPADAEWLAGQIGKDHIGSMMFAKTAKGIIQGKIKAVYETRIVLESSGGDKMADLKDASEVKLLKLSAPPDQATNKAENPPADPRTANAAGDQPAPVADALLPKPAAAQPANAADAQPARPADIKEPTVEPAPPTASATVDTGKVGIDPMTYTLKTAADVTNVAKLLSMHHIGWIVAANSPKGALGGVLKSVEGTRIIVHSSSGSGTRDLSEVTDIMLFDISESKAVAAGGSTESTNKSSDGQAYVVWARVSKVLEMAVSETTVAQYRACVDAGACGTTAVTNTYWNRVPVPKFDKYCNWAYQDRGDHPMNCVSWTQAQKFCEWTGGRLPTNEEWEAEASRGFVRKYSWGDDAPDCTFAVIAVSAFGCGKRRTWPVCEKPAGASLHGLCDMTGNVWEWTSDKRGDTYLAKGGSWSSPPDERVESQFNFPVISVDRAGELGFRCVRDVR